MSAAANQRDARSTKTVERELAEAKRGYSLRNPASFERWQAAACAMPGGNTRTVLFFEPFPICMVRGEGCLLFDADGHRYVDLLGEYTAGIYGHSNPVIRRAIAAALDNGISLSAHNHLELGLARLICDRFTSIELVRFTNSGTEANLMAIATAIAATGRRRVLVFQGSYHGGVLAFGTGPSRTTVPHDFIVAPYNDTDGVRELIRRDGAALAAILVEPMLGAGGCVPGEPAFLEMLAEEARAAGAMLVFDEIQTSRLSPGGRQELLGISPDLTTLGKYFGGGLSFGAFGGRANLMSLYDPRRPDHLAHAGTFNNNVLSMAAGYAGLSQLLSPDALQSLNRRGDALRTALNEQFAESACGLSVSGLGSLMNFHAINGIPSERDVLLLLFFDLLERGFYCSPRGLIALSLAVGDPELAEFRSVIGDILRARRSAYTFDH